MSERREWLRERLDAHGAVGIIDAAAELGVSEMTIRRDLLELEAVGHARRVRGGAVAVGPEQMADRRSHHSKAKSKIADKLQRLVPQSGAIGLDASSTMLRLATAITGARDLMVVTNGPDAFAALQGRGGVRPLLTGGELDARTGSLVGPLAARSATSIVTSRLFISAAALDSELGLTEPTLDEAEVKRAMAASSAEVVVAVDSSKLGTRALAQGVEWDRVSLLVTELAVNDRRLADYRDRVELL